MKKIKLLLMCMLIFSQYTFSQENSNASRIVGVDAVAVDVFPPYIVKDNVFHPYVEVESVGDILLNDVEVIYELLDTSNNVVLTNTQSFSGLSLNTLEKKKLKLDTDWLVDVAGNFKIKCTLNVAFDSDPSNNILEEDAESIALSYDNIEPGAGYVSSKTNLYKTDVNNTALESIATYTEEIIFVGLDFIDDVLYGVYTKNNIATNMFEDFFFIMNGDGSVYTLGQIEYEFFMNGISWDETTNKVYVVGGQGLNYSDLFELDKETLDIELVTRMGQFGENAYVAMEFDSEGTLYGLNWQNTRLEVIDVVTGEVTPMPNETGYYFYSSAQDLSFNKSDNKLYGSVFDFDPTALFYTSFDLTTGIAQAIDSIPGENTMAIAHPSNIILGLDTLDNTEFKIYPNPATDIIFIDSRGNNNENFVLTLFDITGKQIKLNNFSNEYINVGRLPSGIYMLQIRFKNSSLNYKIIKQ